MLPGAADDDRTRPIFCARWAPRAERLTQDQVARRPLVTAHWNRSMARSRDDWIHTNRLAGHGDDARGAGQAETAFPVARELDLQQTRKARCRHNEADSWSMRESAVSRSSRRGRSLVGPASQRSVRGLLPPRMCSSECSTARTESLLVSLILTRIARASVRRILARTPCCC